MEERGAESEEKTNEDRLSFEEALSRLEEIVGRLERGELNLEDALESFEEGVKLSRYCSRRLREGEKRVRILVEKEDTGQLDLREFEAEDDPAGGEGDDA